MILLHIVKLLTQYCWCLEKCY